MTGLRTRIRRRPNLAYELAVLALAVAFAVGLLTIAYHYSDRTRIAQATAKATRENTDLLTKVQDGLCGFFQPIAAVPLSLPSQPLGRVLIKASGHATLVINCPPAAPHRP